MFNAQSFRNTLPLAQKLASTGKVAVAAPNTVLSELVRFSIPSFEFKVNSQQDLDSYPQAIEASTTGTLENPSSHSLQLDALISDLSKLVTQHINYAKNSVKPLVIDFAEAVIAYKQNNTVIDATSKFNIITLNVPSVLQDQSFLDNFTAYLEKTPLSPDLKFNLEDKSEEELNKFILIGHDRTDQLIVEWLSQQEEHFLSNVWKSFFTNLGAAGSVMTFQGIERLNPYEKANYALAIYLLGNKLFNDVQSAQEMNLATYKSTAVQYRDYGGALLSDSIKKMVNFNKTRILVIEQGYDRYTVKVNGEVYREWLKTGGSTDILLGLVISEDNTSSQVLIDQKAEEYKSRWNSFCTYYKTSEANKAFAYLKEFLLNEFSARLKTIDDIEKEYIEKNPNYYSTVKKLSEDFINAAKEKDLEDPYGIALELVAKCRFYYTSAYSILSDINVASKVNPDVDVREAALLAAINYVADYVTDQIAIAA